MPETPSPAARPIFCGSCGSLILSDQAFCRFCGSRTAENIPSAGAIHAPLPHFTSSADHSSSKSAIVFVIICIAVAVAIVSLAFGIRGMPQNTSVENSSAVAASPYPPALSEAIEGRGPHGSDAIYKMNESLRVGYWSYICERAFWSPVLGSNPYTMQRANADFLVIQISVSNEDQSASVIPQFELVDTDGRSYSESSAGMLGGGFFGPFEQLNPNVSKDALVAFDVPSDRYYELVLSGGIESEEKAVVDLDLGPPQSR